MSNESPSITKQVFTRHYTTNHWGSSESFSGKGSTRFYAKYLIERLPLLLRMLDVKSMVDAPCGDLNYMKEIDLTGIDYLGLDIVDSLIERNREKFADRPNMRFASADLTQYAIPAVDLIVCRDVLIHVANDVVVDILRNFLRSGSKYLLCGNYFAQVGAREINSDIPVGKFRGVDLLASPFGLPAPILYLPERGFVGKVMALWKLEDIAYDLSRM